MGTVYRKVVTKPIPEGAEIVIRNGEKVARWKVRGKTRTAPVTAKGRIAIESSTFTAKYRDGDHIVREVATGCKDETAARKVLSDLERRAELVKVGLLKPEEDSAADHLATPIGKQFTAYLNHLAAEGVSKTHRKNVQRHLTTIAAACGFRQLADLDRGKLSIWLNEQQQAKKSARTRNTYLASAIAFCNWCCNSDHPRLTNNPFSRIPKANEEADPRRKRRAMTEEELLKLLDVARRRPLVEAMTIRRGKRKGELGAKVSDGTRQKLELLGWERALIYKALVLTGLRKN